VFKYKKNIANQQRPTKISKRTF